MCNKGLDCCDIHSLIIPITAAIDGTTHQTVDQYIGLFLYWSNQTVSIQGDYNTIIFLRSEVEDNFEVACTRVYDVNFIPTMGLHMHCPVLFDYFHMAAICLTVHASLIALHQPIYKYVSSV